MEKGPNAWSDALSVQAIPAEIVNWENIIASPEDIEPDGDSEHLDAEATIGDPPTEEEQESDRP